MGVWRAWAVCVWGLAFVEVCLPVCLFVFCLFVWSLLRCEERMRLERKALGEPSGNSGSYLSCTTDAWSRMKIPTASQQMSATYPSPQNAVRYAINMGCASTDRNTSLPGDASHPSIPPRSVRPPSADSAVPAIALRRAVPTLSLASPRWLSMASLAAATSAALSTPGTTTNPFKSNRKSAFPGSAPTSSAALLAIVLVLWLLVWRVRIRADCMRGLAIVLYPWCMRRRSFDFVGKLLASQSQANREQHQQAWRGSGLTSLLRSRPPAWSTEGADVATRRRKESRKLLLHNDLNAWRSMRYLEA